MVTEPVIEIVGPWKDALDLLERSSRHVLLTGKAGTGKSTLLRHFIATTAKSVAVVAPTGVAALNVEGQTIHSFFRFPPAVTPETVKAPRGESPARKIQTLVIDEVSMVRADLLDCVDKALRLARRKPAVKFGGVQLVMIGDLYQIPPVVRREEREAIRGQYASEYFFSSRAFAGLDLEYVELEKVYRQRDPGFVALLNAIRNNTVTAEHLARVNARMQPGYEPGPDELCVTLTPTNAAADAVNARRLDALPGAPRRFTGEVEGQFAASALPVPEELLVKPGAQVMMTKNHPEGRWVNGTLGRVHAVGRRNGHDALEVEFAGGRRETVTRDAWELFRYVWDRAAKRLETEVTGTYTHFPLRLAWAVTIHKSQGKTFDRLILDLGRGAFATGQTYVALSRCTSLEGLVLRRPLARRDILVDRTIVKFVTGFQYARAEARQPLAEKVRIIRAAIAAGSPLLLTYLKASDERSVRTVTPRVLEEMTYEKITFLGLSAWCHERRADRVFRVDRILDVSPT